MAIDKKQFEQHVFSPDSSFEVLLRGHLWAEFLVTKLLEVNMTDAQALDLDRTGFRQKADIAQAFGFLTRAEGDALRALNKLRNKLAHSLGAEPSEDDIRGLETALRGRPRAIFDSVISAGAPLDDQPVSVPLVRLKYWLFSFAFLLDAHIARAEYEGKYETEIVKFHAIKIASEQYAHRPMSDEAARRQAGLPDPPRADASWTS